MRILTTVIAMAAVGSCTAPGTAAEIQALQARGVQIYVCEAAAAKPAWHFTAPEATLLGPAGEAVGRHFAGPTWQANDGSRIVGMVIASNGGGDAAIPWLLLRASAHHGAGRFAHVNYIVRSQTKGGAAPAAGCDARHIGIAERVDYTATYIFFSE